MTDSTASGVAVRAVAPRLGQHTDEVLGAFGYPASAVEQLRRDRVV